MVHRLGPIEDGAGAARSIARAVAVARIWPARLTRRGHDRVSIIIPAHNAASTIKDALHSVLEQSLPYWEAIVIDDGSSDETAAIVAAHAANEPRFRLLRQQKGGVSVARNVGINAARHEWLLFLDADDWLEPRHLELCLRRARKRDRPDIVHAGWARVTPASERSETQFAPDQRDLFETLTQYCPFAVHACISRTSLVQELGGFDTEIGQCEDFDLWQRAARTGARFGRVDHLLALYRMRPGSASADPIALVRGGLAVIGRGHQRDQRVRSPTPQHIDGATRDSLPGALFSFAAWCGGLAIGMKRDPIRLQILDLLTGRRAPGLDPAKIAAVLFEAIPVGACTIEPHWHALWPDVQTRIRDFLDELERRTAAPMLRSRTLRRLEERIISASPLTTPLVVGTTYGVRVLLDVGVAAIDIPKSCNRLHCRVEMEGKQLGALPLSSFDAANGAAIAEAVVEALAWPIFKSRLCTLRHSPTTALQTVAALFSRQYVRIGLQLVNDRQAGRYDIIKAVGKLVAADVVRRMHLWRTVPANFTPAAPNEQLSQLIRQEWMQQARSVPPPLGVPAPEAAKRNTLESEAARWERVFAKADPWNYGSKYEQVKYQQTLSLLPGRPNRALELACAEGHFSVLVAPLVNRLVAADISATALGRAAIRCRNEQNVEFCRLDLIADDLPGIFDLIVCSEVLYYLPDHRALRAVADRIAAHLKPGGHLLMAHAQLIVDDTEHTGFDWDLPFGTRVIGDHFAAHPLFTLKAEIRTPLYRIHLFQRDKKRSGISHPHLVIAQHGELEPAVAAQIIWDGCSLSPTEARRREITNRLPILMYHRIGANGPPGLSRYRVTAEAFEQQLAYLRRNGYYGVSLKRWQASIAASHPLPGRAVAITFDDGYRDFATTAWPLLQRNGFTATVFVVANSVGRRADWDQAHGEPAPLLTWDEVRKLRNEGVEFGCHGAQHSLLTELATDELIRDGARARAILYRELGQSTEIIAYPYGDLDPVVRRSMRYCGYTMGLTTQSRRSSIYDDPLLLPRLEVRGDLTLEQFASMLGEPTPRGRLYRLLGSIHASARRWKSRRVGA